MYFICEPFYINPISICMVGNKALNFFWAEDIFNRHHQQPVIGCQLSEVTHLLLLWQHIFIITTTWIGEPTLDLDPFKTLQTETVTLKNLEWRNASGWQHQQVGLPWETELGWRGWWGLYLFSFTNVWADCWLLFHLYWQIQIFSNLKLDVETCKFEVC